MKGGRDRAEKFKSWMKRRRKGKKRRKFRMKERIERRKDVDDRTIIKKS